MADHLRSARVAARLTQTAAASALRLHPSLLSKFETGEREASPAQLYAIGRLYSEDHLSLMIRAGYLELPGFGEVTPLLSALAKPITESSWTELLLSMSTDERRLVLTALVGARVSAVLVSAAAAAATVETV